MPMKSVSTTYYYELSKHPTRVVRVLPCPEFSRLSRRMLSTLTQGQTCIAEVGEYEEESNGWNASVSFITTGSVTTMGRC
jgi:hypothetical protein